MRRHAITLALLLLAVMFYAIGLAMPATVLIVLGLVAEGAFWLRLVGRRRK